ncbi:MAG: TadE/TadG family type IV pilus assembly protein [Rhodospirillales bacterium]
MIIEWIRAFGRSERGNFLVELAFAMPVVMALLLTGVEFTRYMLINQKLERTSATIADLVAQSYGMSEAEMASLFSATEFIMDPFSLVSDGAVVVSSIGASGGSGPVINWQRAFGGGSGGSEFGTEGETADLPPGLDVRDGESLVAAEAFFDYQPVILQQILASRTLYRWAVFRPRFSSLTEIRP